MFVKQKQLECVCNSILDREYTRIDIEPLINSTNWMKSPVGSIWISLILRMFDSAATFMKQIQFFVKNGPPMLLSRDKYASFKWNPWVHGA